MKKLNERHKRHLLHRQRKENAKLCSRPRFEVSSRRALAYQAFCETRSQLPAYEPDFGSRPGYLVFSPPEVLSFTRNYEPTLAFIMDMRELPWALQRSKETKRVPPFAEFSKIREIDPGTALVLAAEVDRWRSGGSRRMQSYDLDWHPPVRRFFRQAGLFELLGVIPQCDEADQEGEPGIGDVQTLKFVRGYSVQGEIGSKLRDRLEEMCGKSIGPRMTVYEAIAEAIANTRHAYPPGSAIWPLKLGGRWWASGSWMPETNTVSLQLYDQGVGIPATLPRSEHWSDVVRLPILGEVVARLSKRLHPEYDDDRLLQAALEIGRTSTGLRGRGKGLAEMATWIEKLGNGYLRVSSGRGVVTYRPGGLIERELRRVSFAGTLIEWEIGLRD